MTTRSDSALLTAPCELHAVPWHDLAEKREFSDSLDSMLEGFLVSDIHEWKSEANILAMKKRSLYG